MSYAVMPLADYKTACDKIREKVVLTTVVFEDTDFGYFRSAPFNFEEGKTYTINISVTDNRVDFVVGSEEWNNTSPPWEFQFENNSFTARYDYEACVYINKHSSLTINDITLATIECDGEIVANFVEPQKIKSGELADRIEDVAKTVEESFNLTLTEIESSLDSIIALQNSIIEGDV
jgi:hypothetical protein